MEIGTNEQTTSALARGSAVHRIVGAGFLDLLGVEMTERNDGGPAFPRRAALVDGTICEEQSGMTLRQYYKAAALTGILAGGFADTVPHDDVAGGKDAAFFAAQYADAMIAEDESHE
jgi:hypothetical protein